MRYRLDSSVVRLPDGLLGGSPLSYLRLTEAGRRVVDQMASGQEVAESVLTRRLVELGAAQPQPAGTSLTAADITVVIPVKDHDPTATIESLSRSERWLGLGFASIVLVDDGSDIPVPDADVRHQHPRGPGAARRSGLELVTTELVAFLDADVTVEPDWLPAVLAHFGDRAVAAVAPRIRSRAGAGVRARYERGHSPLDLGPDPARVRPMSRVSYVPSAVLVCRTQDVRDVGGFDPILRYGEDVDLVWRLLDAGRVVVYEPAAGAEHRPRSTWTGWVRQRWSYGSSSGPLAARHPGRLAPVAVSGWSWAVWGALIAGEPLVAAAIIGGTGAALGRKLPTVPTAQIIRLTARGHLLAGPQLATAVRRAWLPLLALAALRFRPARRVLRWSILATLADPRTSGDLDRLRSAALLALDDASFCAGVWTGVVASRNVGPLMPRWSGRVERVRVTDSVHRG